VAGAQNRPKPIQNRPKTVGRCTKLPKPNEFLKKILVLYFLLEFIRFWRFCAPANGFGPVLNGFWPVWVPVTKNTPNIKIMQVRTPGRPRPTRQLLKIPTREVRHATENSCFLKALAAVVRRTSTPGVASTTSSQWTSHSLPASRHKRLRLASMLRTFLFRQRAANPTSLRCIQLVPTLPLRRASA